MIDQFIQQIKNAWSAETSADPDNWSPDNPAWGQCAVTASLIAEKFGGDLFRVEYETPKGEKSSHYFNYIEGIGVVDATLEQFPDGTEFTPPLESDVAVLRQVTSDYLDKKDFDGTALEYVVSVPATQERLESLKSKIRPLPSGSTACDGPMPGM